MAIGLIGKKLGMTQVFTKEGNLVSVTVIEAAPCTVVQKKTKATDGYAAVQLGAGEQKAQRLTKAAVGHRKKAGKMARLLKEFRTDDSFEVGQELAAADFFQPGDKIDVTGTTKGRGFQGVMKRHHFSGFPATHGTHEYFRHGGSIGNRTHPGRVFKNKRMAGRMGGLRRTILNLTVVDVRPEENVVLVEGSIPGGRNGWVYLRKAVRQTEARHG
jgi:large subunit ribosomal protein L3